MLITRPTNGVHLLTSIPSTFSVASRTWTFYVSGSPELLLIVAAALAGNRVRLRRGTYKRPDTNYDEDVADRPLHRSKTPE
jgi:hypothetical protein